MGFSAASCIKAWGRRRRQLTIENWRVEVMLITIVEGAGAMEMRRWGMLGGKGTGSGAAVGAEPIGEATEVVALVDLPALIGLEIFGNFQTMVPARGATHTPLAQGREATRILRVGRSPRIVAELSR